LSPKTKIQKGARASETITLDQVRRLAGLSRLTLSSAEEEKLTREFWSILEYFRVVDKVGDSPAPESDSVGNSLRPDEVGPSDPEGVMKGVPRRKGRFVRAPRVF
jgi:aspartyl/glutamyl-tRNA(Asn/Gln) amidotransferase C subunit